MSVQIEKLREAILYFAGHPEVRDLGVTKLYTLLYYADAGCLGANGKESITGSDYIRYPQGPVPSRAEKMLKKLRKEGAVATATEDFHGYKLSAVRATRQAETAAFSKEELVVLDSVARELGSLSAAELSSRSHAEPAWLYAGPLERLDAALMLYGDSEDPDGL